MNTLVEFMFTAANSAGRAALVDDGIAPEMKRFFCRPRKPIAYRNENYR